MGGSERYKKASNALELLSPSEDDEGHLLTQECHFTDRDNNVGLVEPIHRKFVWGNVSLVMQVDTGSPVSVVSQGVYERFKQASPTVEKTRVRLTCFLGSFPVRGELNLRVTYQDKTVDSKLIVLGCPGPSLRGRDLIRDMNSCGASVLHLASGQTSSEGAGRVPSSATDSNLQAILTEYADLFEPVLGSLKGSPVKLQLRRDATPKFIKARPVPYAL